MFKIFFIFVNVKVILCICRISVINLCENLDDIKIYGGKDWKYVSISPEASCQNDDTNKPNQQLKATMFDATPTLEGLYIGEKLNIIDAFAFSSLTNIQFIKLWKNRLPVIHKNVFSGLPSLRKIDIQENAIENLQHGCFFNSPTKEIDLSNNKLTNIQVDMLDLKSLTKISLSGNQISLLVDGCFGKNVQHLDLSRNFISAFSTGVLNNLIQLEYLNLSRNALSSVTADYGKVTALRTVKILDLSYNNIQTIEKNCFMQLLNAQYLYLNDNKIQFLMSSSFPFVNNLKALFLHRNWLGGLDPDLANKVMGLKQITLGANPWVCSYWLTIERHLDSIRPKCDIDATSGENPVCVASEDQINTAETFHKLYDCEYQTVSSTILL